MRSALKSTGAEHLARVLPATTASALRVASAVCHCDRNAAANELRTVVSGLSFSPPVVVTRGAARLVTVFLVGVMFYRYRERIRSMAALPAAATALLSRRGLVFSSAKPARYDRRDADGAALQLL